MSAAENYIAQRRIGDAVVTVINEGGMVWPPKYPVSEPEWRAALPEAGARGEIPIDFLIAHVRLGDASIMIDPGLDDPNSPWEERFEGHWEGVYRTPGMAAALDQLGITPDEITHVLITHAHDDHFGGLTVDRDGEPQLRFPNATVSIGRADWEEHPWRGRPGAEVDARLGLAARAGKLEVVDGDQEIVPGVTMLATPGESRGHSVIRVRSGGDSFYYVGDLFHHTAEVANLDWVSPGRDKNIMRASRERFLADAVPANGIVLFSHDRFPGWGRIVATDGGYQYEHVE
ncbi:MAG TPA: MBL fold metallo-hydrolase [Thermomicrobiaceae bacterium]|nr:MBL fold metallo-hydrolase [Thermomicrobiaceae bacterium]